MMEETMCLKTGLFGLLVVLASSTAFAHPLKLVEPTNRFETSEVRGLYTEEGRKISPFEQFGYRFELLTSRSNELIFTRSYRNQPPGLQDNDNVRYGLFHNTGFRFGVSVAEPLEFSISYYSEDTPTLVGVKIQWLGKSSRQALKGDFSLASMGAIGLWSDKDTTAPIPTGSYESEYTAYSGDVIAGYRLRDSLLLYSGLNFLYTKVEGHVQQPIQEGFGVHYHYYFNGNYKQYMMTLGSMFEYEFEGRGNAFIKAEFSTVRFDYYSTRYFPINFGLSGGIQL